MNDDDRDLFFEMLNKGEDIVEHSMVFEMRRRMNLHHPEEVKQREQHMHDMHQQIAWQEVKQLYINNIEIMEEIGHELDQYLDPHDKRRNTYKAIKDLVDGEIDEIILGEIQ